MIRKTVTVGELNRYIKELITRDDCLSALWLQGEISNLKYHSSGHVYFSLKDEAGVIKCVMFRSRSALLKFRLEEGMKVIAFGSVDVFEQGGQYQFYAERIEPDGAGALYAAFERLKARLLAEGLFEQDRKKRLPLLPKCVGVVTSPTGAVIQDIKNVAARRFAEIPIVLYGAPVQGKDAAPLIAEAIRKAGAEGKCDVIIVARGGGSLEDLWCFNEECVARAIYDCPVPVVSAVGHETDFTIADFAADMRAPTPSAAAELVIPEKAVLKVNLKELKVRLLAAPDRTLLLKRSCLEHTEMRLDLVSSRLLSGKKLRLQSLEKALKAFNVESILIKRRTRLENLSERLDYVVAQGIERQRHRVNLAAEKLNVLGPNAVLARGYSIAVRKDGSAMSSVEDFSEGESFELVLKDGKIDAAVTDTCLFP